MLLSTTPTLEGHQIQQYLGLVSGEVIIGANFIKDFTASLHDFFGGRSSSYEQTLIEAKEAALKEIASVPQDWAQTPSLASTSTTRL